MNILAIGAHPDDIELGCGGTLLKTARQGHNIYLYTLTQGGAAGQVIRRANELVNSAKFIGARVLWIDAFEDSKVYLTSELINNLEYFIVKSRADIVYTHSLQDNHHDHRAIAEATLEAGRFCPNIVAYENPSTRNFYPSIYYDISDVIAEKVQLIELFGSQKSKLFITTNAIKGLAEYRAFQSRLGKAITHVESFEALKISFEKDLTLLKSEPISTSSETTKPGLFPKKVIEYKIPDYSTRDNA